MEYHEFASRKISAPNGMTKQEFLTTFEKHLLVGEPKRSEIITELQKHAEVDGYTVLGKPATLAAKYNRVYLGLFHSLPLLFGIPIASWIFFEYIVWRPIYFLVHISHQAFRIAASLESILSHLALPIIVLLSAHALSQIHQPRKRMLQWLSMMLGTALITNGEVIYAEIYQNSPASTWIQSLRLHGGDMMLFAFSLMAIMGFFVLYRTFTRQLSTRAVILDYVYFGTIGTVSGYFFFYYGLYDILIYTNSLAHDSIPWQLVNLYTPSTSAILTALVMIFLAALHRHRSTADHRILAQL